MQAFTQRWDEQSNLYAVWDVHVVSSIDLGRVGGARCERGTLPMLPQGGGGAGGAHARHNNKRDSALASRVRLKLRFFLIECGKEGCFSLLNVGKTSDEFNVFLF